MLSSTVGGTLLAAIGTRSSAALLQASEVNQARFDPVTEAVLEFFLTLTIGMMLLSVAPNYVDRIVEDVLEKPIANFAWGVLLLIVFILATYLLVTMMIDIILAAPLIFAFLVILIVGNVLAWLTVCDMFVDSRWTALVVAAVVAPAVGLIPVVGTLVGFVIFTVGMGAVARHWVE